MYNYKALSENTIRSTLELCKPFLLRHRLSFFDYGRFYDDGSGFVFSNRPELISHFFDNQYPLTTPVPDRLLSSKFWYIIPEDGSYSKAVYDARCLFGVAHPIDLIERSNDFFEMFCFGASPNYEQATHFYLNNLDLLEGFAHHFKEQMKKEIYDANQERFTLSASMRPSINWQKLSQSNLNLKLFTLREQECLKYLLKGYTSKKIADHLGLSVRTIEFYVNQIKEKLGCKKKSDIGDAFLLRSLGEWNHSSPLICSTNRGGSRLSRYGQSIQTMSNK